MRRRARSIRFSSDDNEDNEEDDDYYSNAHSEKSEDHSNHIKVSHFDPSSYKQKLVSVRETQRNRKFSSLQKHLNTETPSFSVSIENPSKPSAAFNDASLGKKSTEHQIDGIRNGSSNLQMEGNDKELDTDNNEDESTTFKDEEDDLISPKSYLTSSKTFSYPKAPTESTNGDYLDEDYVDGQSDPESSNASDSDFADSPDDLTKVRSPIPSRRGRRKRKMRGPILPVKKNLRVKKEMSPLRAERNSPDFRRKLRSRDNRPNYHLFDYYNEIASSPNPSTTKITYNPPKLPMKDFATLPIGYQSTCDSDETSELSSTSSEQTSDVEGLNAYNNLGASSDIENAPSSQLHFGHIDEKTIRSTDPFANRENLDFNSIGGLEDIILQLKEMVMLPLLYPEVFLHLHITPPRGVLFHGPPGTGKTLMARVLAANCSTKNQKISFFLRKGSDCLSKWVGEAERQLRLLFEEARRVQPSIIFFDEIDGLAPIRSSKQEQTHSSIVSTLLALMDGLDTRGQVVVIGATNRPNDLDPALRRPGRFDREFYFPLPNKQARMKILEINSLHFSPKIPESYLLHLAESTSGYGGADLKALCTEAALNAVRRTFPQIYTSSDKFLIDLNEISVSICDFVVASEKIAVSTRRSDVKPNIPITDSHKILFKKSIEVITSKIRRLLKLDVYLPTVESLQKLPAEELMRQKEINSLKTTMSFRPRLLINDIYGYGCTYLSKVLFSMLDGIHVQSLDISELLMDTTTSPRSLLTKIFSEARKNAPSIIFINNVEKWPSLFSHSFLSMFLLLLDSISPLEPVMLLGFANTNQEKLSSTVRSWFPSHRSEYHDLSFPDYSSRYSFFHYLLKRISFLPIHQKSAEAASVDILPKVLPVSKTSDLTDKVNRRQRKNDKKIKNKIQVKLSSILEMLRSRYKKFKKPIIDLNDIYIDESNESVVKGKSKDNFEYFLSGNTVTRKKDNACFKMMNFEEIERRLWSGRYCTPKEFLRDIKMIKQDAILSGDVNLKHKAKEMFAHAELNVDELIDAKLLYDCCQVSKREKAYKQLKQKKLNNAKDAHEMQESKNEETFVRNDVAQEDNFIELSSNEVRNVSNDEHKHTLFHGQSLTHNNLIAVTPPSRTGVEHKEENKKYDNVNIQKTLAKCAEEFAEHTNFNKVELLDFVYSKLSSTIWENREEHDLLKIVRDVRQTFFRSLEDMGV
ncbi:ATPase with bromodomain protein [Schizosaccharomyces pombe]